MQSMTEQMTEQGIAEQVTEQRMPNAVRQTARIFPAPGSEQLQAFETNVEFQAIYSMISTGCNAGHELLRDNLTGKPGSGIPSKNFRSPSTRRQAPLLPAPECPSFNGHLFPPNPPLGAQGPLVDQDAAMSCALPLMRARVSSQPLFQLLLPLAYLPRQRMKAS